MSDILKNRNLNEEGFTLIEVVITAALFIIALLPLVTLMESSALMGRNSQLAITATNLANEEMEQMKGLAYMKVGLNSAGANPTGTVSPLTNYRPTAMTTTTLTVLRTISWYPSSDNRLAKRVTINVRNPADLKILATLTNFIGQTGMIAFNETPAETVTPSVSLVYPTAGAIISFATPTFHANAGDPSPGRILNVRYFISPVGGSYYGYREALYPGPDQYAADMDAFNIIVPEPAIPDGTYTVFAQATDINGNSANSTARTCYFRVPPLAPTNLSATLLFDTVPASVMLSWTPSKTNDSISYYQIYRRTKGTSDPGDWPAKTEYAKVSGSIASFVDTNTVPGKLHRYAVKSFENTVTAYGLASTATAEFEIDVP